MQIEEKDFPACYLDSDQSSKRAQKIYKSITYGILSLLFVSSIYSGISAINIIQSDLPDKINGVLLLLTSIASVVMLVMKPEKNWYLGRAVSESVKTLTWRFMMRAEPFNDQDENINIDALSNRLKDILSEANKEGFYPASNKYHLDEITQKMQSVQAMDYLSRKGLYATERINDQINWYEKKSRRNRRLGFTYSILLIVFQVIAALYLIFFESYLKVFKLDEIMVFLATAVISILELNKHKDLAQSYGLTKTELRFIRSRFGTIKDQNDLNAFVLDAEQAISREHTMWLARRGV